MARIFCTFVFSKLIGPYCSAFFKQGIYPSIAAVWLWQCKSVNSVRFLDRDLEVQHFHGLINFPMHDVELFRSLFVKSSGKFHYIFYHGASQLDWYERELNETTVNPTISKNDCTALFMDWLCLFLYQCFCPRFTFYFSVQLSRGEEILLKSIVLAFLHCFFFPNWHYFYISRPPITRLKEKDCLKVRVNSGITAHMVYFRHWYYCTYGLF